MAVQRMAVLLAGALAGFALVGAGIAMPASGAADAALEARPRDHDHGLEITICVDLSTLVGVKAGIGIGARPCGCRPLCAPPKAVPPPKAAPPKPHRPPRAPRPPQPVRPPAPPPPSARPAPPVRHEPRPPMEVHRPSPSIMPAHRLRAPQAAHPVRRRRNPLATVVVMVILSTMIAAAASVAFATLR
ncbi:hypothetical protein N5079_11405 [Planotetraspora sp. A-T 1434]|uniref:hypothetical protein n=1 Tax=Planotetraspora sp. A-T 1434 TaxID=2979219 RepID=UPI0021BE50E1|nr:hypothetical protein [Planotetraspora sp. A-T 1434]MCT9930825.1 hypothetical protein [Planotetraspora sp. A-T 1434]